MIFLLFVLQYYNIYGIIKFRFKKEDFFMRKIIGETFDQERALYGVGFVCLTDCKFDGEADGESALKESNNIKAEKCFFNLRYPLWHDNKVDIIGCEMSSLCRAPLWYTTEVLASRSVLHGPKALRECRDISIDHCDIDSVEFGWFSSNIKILNSMAKGEYFMLRAKELDLEDVDFSGKYSFQYIENAVFENCNFDTKDAFWHAKNVTVKNCVVKGEYLAWYSENVTFENCVISGTQPLCYCKGLRLINCEMHDADLAFELSDVEATITTPMISIKNPLQGRISVPCVDELISDDIGSTCEIVFTA